jgi:hypothetical protein
VIGHFRWGAKDYLVEALNGKSRTDDGYKSTAQHLEARLRQAAMMSRNRAWLSRDVEL